MTQPNPSIALARVVMDELARHGVDFVTLSPGSRSGALAVAATEHRGVSERVFIDERSAAFCALGRAKATGVPAVVISTSGTAPANFMPAVVEADMALTPIVVISADRPSEMHGIGANQTIDQVGLFGDKVRYSAGIEAPGPDDDLNDHWRSTISEAVMASLGHSGMPGPVHVNIAFREPTVPVSDDGRSHSPPYRHAIGGDPTGRPWISAERGVEPGLPVELPASQRGIVIAGDGSYDRDGLRSAASALGWPLLATALSGLRGRGTVSTYHHLLAGGVPAPLRPEIVVAIGSVGPSARLEQLIASAPTRFRVDSLGRNIDPGLNATAVVRGDPVRLLSQLKDGVVDHQWVGLWTRLDTDLRRAMTAHLSELDGASGPGVACVLNESSWNALVAGSSLPIRDVDSQLDRAGAVMGNRGASGIDGLVSTSLGVASARRDTVALSGDLSVLHDSNGFLADRLDDLVIVVVDNNGGGLFDSLPQAVHAPSFERLFIAPHNRDLAKLAAFHELGYRETEAVRSLPDLISKAQGSGGVWLIHVPVDRRHDLEVRAALDRIGGESVRSIEP